MINHCKSCIPTSLLAKPLYGFIWYHSCWCSISWYSHCTLESPRRAKRHGEFGTHAKGRFRGRGSLHGDPTSSAKAWVLKLSAIKWMVGMKHILDILLYSSCTREILGLPGEDGSLTHLLTSAFTTYQIFETACSLISLIRQSSLLVSTLAPLGLHVGSRLDLSSGHRPLQKALVAGVPVQWPDLMNSCCFDTWGKRCESIQMI
jgi:hypothetical protein